MTIIQKGERMSDLISRQAAIDALDVGAELLRRVLDNADIVGAEREKYKWGLGLIESCISDMEELPSAQPEPIKINIDHELTKDEYEKLLKDMADAPIVLLPSAQPERTCVNCGRTANNGGWYADGGTRCPIEEHYALPKDGYCHLWEKRNVTDDDYPEGRADE